MRKVSILFFGIGLFLFFAPQANAADLAAGDLIKASQPAVYYYGADGKRYVFPNEKTYKTWYDDFSTVKTITDDELAAISIGGNATYKPGVKMVKILTDPKVYAVSKGGNLCWVKTEALAISLYGADWNKKIEDVPDAFFTNYLVGSPLESEADYSVSSELAAAISINVDKNLSALLVTPVIPPAPVYSWNIKTINEDVYSHQNLSLGNFANGFMASWNDDRNGQNEIYYQTTDLTAAGTGVANRVSSNITDSKNAKNSFDGTNLYFLWEDSSSQKRAINSQKYDLEGNKVKLSVFASTTYATSKYPDIAWNGTMGKYGVVWWDTRKTMSGGSGDLYFSLMKDGLKIGAETVLTTAASPEFKPRAVSADNNFAAIWQEGDLSIRVALVDSNSTLVGSVKNIYTAGEAVEPRIAWSGNGFGAVWAEKVGDNQDIYFMQLDGSGNKAGDKIALTSGIGDAVEPSITWFDGKYYVSYTDYKANFAATSALSDIYIVKISADGVAEIAKNISLSTVKSYSSNITTSENLIGVAWLEDDGLTNKIMGAVESKL